MTRPISPAVALAIAAIGIGLFSVMDAVMKGLVLAIGVYNAMFWRSLVNVGLGAAAWRLGRSGRPSRRRPQPDIDQRAPEHRVVDADRQHQRLHERVHHREQPDAERGDAERERGGDGLRRGAGQRIRRTSRP